MKFLHTGDWHLGRTVRGKSREDEHRAVLGQILTYADQEAVDFLIVAGDLFDTATPSPESEHLAYQFFLDLHRIQVPAVVIAGNHDHPRRIDAIAPLLAALDVHAIGRPVGPDRGAIIELPSRNGKETAVIAALPWVSEREAISFLTLGQGPGASLGQYAERVKEALDALCAAFRPDTVNVLATHLFVDEAQVGPGGGERALTLSLGIYGVPRQMLPSSPQYIALGHVHKPQAVRPSPPAWYPGSPLQLDFGEQRQDKFVNLVEAHPRRPAEVTQLPLTAGRSLLDVGNAQHGVHLSDLPSWTDQVGDAWLRVFVEIEEPIANLPEVVREHLPNAVHVERVKHEAERGNNQPALSTLGPEELFAAFYRSSLGRGREPTQASVRLFRELLEEEMHAPN